MINFADVFGVKYPLRLIIDGIKRSMIKKNRKDQILMKTENEDISMLAEIDTNPVEVTKEELDQVFPVMTLRNLIMFPSVVMPVTVGRQSTLKLVNTALKKKSSIVIAVSEGIKLADGRYVCELGSVGDYVDAFGHKQLQGTATYLANFLAAECGCKTRAVELSTLQRSASHMASRVDIDEAFMVGGAAVKAADEGDTGKMVVIDRVSYDPYMAATGIYDVHRIANEEKLVPREWMNKDATNVTKDFVDYIKPLIQGDYQPIMVNGMPRHLVLNMKKGRKK